MNATTVAVDLAKTVFQVAQADAQGRIVGSHRLTRVQFERFMANCVAGQVVMEACGSAHHWARSLREQGLAVRLLPPTRVRPYCVRNKTDAADCRALLRANGDPHIREVPVKSVEQQATDLHRTRSQWMATRTQRINALRGFCREFGMPIPAGAKPGLHAIRCLVADPASSLPALLRPTMQLLLVEISQLQERIAQIERDLRCVAARLGARRQRPRLRLLPPFSLARAAPRWLRRCLLRRPARRRRRTCARAES